MTLEINIENLIIARDGLLGLDPEVFDMENYRKVNKNGPSTHFRSFKDCGTVGCALGWCPFIPGLESKESDYNSFGKWLSFERYALRVFGIEEFSPVDNYLFSSDWAGHDNTIEGLIKRMSDIIEGRKKLSNLNVGR